MSPIRIGETLVAGRYRPVRFIAKGGMGEVYEAYDEELRQRVAMKVVRRDVSANPVAMERFKREISLARRVTHPNVSRLFEFGRHQDDEGAVTFLTMELLQGQTLQERIERGPIPAREALPIAAQICAGLGAAHAAGVLHRDLKSSNVMLTKTADGGLRVVITDFGLARALTGDEAVTATLTSTDLMVGTPAYMSPEQAQGGELTPRADVYSLGVLLYEMVTGRVPHQGPTPMAILMNRMQAPPPSPLAVVPTLDPLWDTVIRRCLELRPDRRFESADDVARALAGEAVPAAPPLPLEETSAGEVPAPAVRRRPWRALVASSAAAVLALAATAAFLSGGGARARVPERRSAAVLGFKNLSGRSSQAWLSTALSEMLSAELAAGEQLRTVPGETVARTRIELAVPEVDALAPATLARLHENLGADLVVLGSYVAASDDPGAPLRVDLRVQDASHRRADVVVSETGTPASIIALAQSVGRKLRARLGVAEPSASQAEKVQASFPEDPEAQRLYAEGIARLRAFDLVEARGLLQRAAEAAPRSARIRSALVAAHAGLGDEAHAREAAQAAVDLGGDLPREEHLLLEAQLAGATRNWTKALEDYRALFRFFPDDVEYALRLAGAQVESGNAADALGTLAEAAKISRDPRIPLAEGSAQMALARYKASLVAARRAAQEGTRSGARLLVAEARLLEGDALSRLGDHAGAASACGSARALFAQTGNRLAEARAAMRLADVAFQEGDYDRARLGFTEAVSMSRRVGSRAWELRALHNLADTYEIMGQLSDAHPLFEEVRRLAEELKDPITTGLSDGNLGYLLLLTGDLPAARARVAAGAAESRRVDFGYGLLVALYASSQVELAGANLAEARANASEALSRAEQMGDARFRAYALASLADVDLAQRDLPSARSRGAAALEIRRKIHDRAEELETRLILARVDLEEGKAAAAAEQAGEVARALSAMSLRDDLVQATALFARAAASAGRCAEAKAAALRCRSLLAASQNVPLRMRAALDLARAEASCGTPAAAAEELRRVAADAQSRGYRLTGREAAASLARLGKS